MEFDVERYLEFFRDIEERILACGLSSANEVINSIVIRAWTNGYHSCLKDLGQDYSTLPEKLRGERMAVMGYYSEGGLERLEKIIRKENGK